MSGKTRCWVTKIRSDRDKSKMETAEMRTFRTLLAMVVQNKILRCIIHADWKKQLKYFIWFISEAMVSFQRMLMRWSQYIIQYICHFPLEPEILFPVFKKLILIFQEDNFFPNSLTLFHFFSLFLFLCSTQISIYFFRFGGLQIACSH